MKKSGSRQALQKQPVLKRPALKRPALKRPVLKRPVLKRPKEQSATAKSDSGKVAVAVEAYISKHAQWQEQLAVFRQILSSTELQETIKWGAPSYTLAGKLVVSMHAFKQHCALWFHQGVFLADKKQLLVNAGEGKTRGLRQLRFEQSTTVDSKLVKAYVVEAINNEKAGKKIVPVVKQASIPPELQEKLESDSVLQKAFAGLSPGKQREYAEHIGAAKQEPTRLARLQKATPLIRAGVGLHDKYRNV